jgi:hypothetical protein
VHAPYVSISQVSWPLAENVSCGLGSATWSRPWISAFAEMKVKRTLFWQTIQVSRE